MSETVTVKARVRSQAGSRAAAKLRQQGQLPAIVYGHQQDPVAVTFGAHAFVEALHHGNRIFNVDIDGKQETLLVKDLQYDHLGKSVIHVDLMRVNLSERVRVQVGLELRGIARGTHEGGIIEEVLSQLEIECKVSDIPEVLAVNVKDLGLGDAVHAGQIELPPDTRLITDPEAVVVVCHETRAMGTEEMPEGEAGIEGAEAAPAEPEVITERKEEAAE